MNDISNQVSAYETKKAHLLKELSTTAYEKLRIQKHTASNLFRYGQAKKSPHKAITIKNFDTILSIDTQNGILDVEGLASFEKIVAYTLQRGFLPTVAPELKHITIGGAIVGIGIESTSYKYGFVHNGLLEAEVLLPSGKIVLCQPDNEHADLFHALPNSYGTLGYILRAKIKLYPAQSCVRISSTRFSDATQFINAMQQATNDSSIQFIEGLVFSPQEYYLLTTCFVSSAPQLDDIYRKTIFYKLIQHKSVIYLTTEDYIFRYDPDWFWNIPETPFYNFFRKFAPKSLRNSGFYKKYIDKKNKFLALFGKTSSLGKKDEALIQDWEVPWENAQDLLAFALQQIDLQGKPWAVVPIKTPTSATLYPLKPAMLYFNLGCYCASKRQQANQDPYYNTKIMDSRCFSLNGLKMLYSSTFLSSDQFAALYNGKIYQELKQKYDPNNVLGNLYDKISFQTTA